MADTFNQPHTSWSGLADIAKNLYKGFGNNPRNKELADALLNVSGATPGVGDVQAGIMAANDLKNKKYASALLNGIGALPLIPALGGITAWHGSPYQFNNFDPAKIGTGEGAQAYGHGLYFAENPNVAKQYSGKLSSELSYNGKPMMRDSAKNTKDSAAWALYLADGDKELAKSSGLANPDLIEKLNPNKLQPGGQLYKVDIADETLPRMLNWDKPISEQSKEVQKAISPIVKTYGLPSSEKGSSVYQATKEIFGQEKKLMQQRDALFSKYQKEGMSLSDAVRAMTPEDRASFSSIAEKIGNINKAQEMASNYLQKRGLTGIKYLDEGSRISGDGTSNYVVFDPNTVKILERNGLLLP